MTPFNKILLPLFLTLSLAFGSDAQYEMTQRFPIGCKSYYPAPYTLVQKNDSQKQLCLTLKASSCSSVNNNLYIKCLNSQSRLRKIIISSLQSPECGAIQVTRNTYTTRSPFTITMANKDGISVDKLWTVWTHHTIKDDTQTALHVSHERSFLKEPDNDLDGYTMCINGMLWMRCVVDRNNVIRMASSNVTDLSCDSSFSLELMKDPITLEGKLSFVEQKWILKTLYGETYTLPTQPLNAANNQVIPLNSWLSLICIPLYAEEFTCVKIQDPKVTHAATPTVILPLQIMIVNVQGNGSTCPSLESPISVNDIENAFFKQDGHTDFFDNCSYGQLTFSKSSFQATTVTIPCTDKVISCDVDEIAAIIMQNMQSTSDANKTMKKLNLYVLPTEIIMNCGWVGIAERLGTKSWYSSTTDGILSQGTVMQEILVNMGLYNAWKDGVMFDDYSTSMGFGESCPSAPELYQLGWATPLAELNSTSFAPNTYANFTIPATYLSPSGAFLKMKPDWLGYEYTKNLYLSLRVKAGGDRLLINEFDGKLNIHASSAKFDKELPFEEPFNTLVSVIDTRMSVTFFNYKVHLITGELTRNGTAINITLCRFNFGPTDCQFVSEF